jgi:hypothetical protein
MPDLKVGAKITVESKEANHLRRGPFKIESRNGSDMGSNQRRTSATFPETVGMPNFFWGLFYGFGTSRTGWNFTSTNNPLNDK